MERGSATAACIYCGTAPAPHALLYIDTAVTIFFGRFMRILSKPGFFLLSPLVIWLTNVSTHGIFSLFSMLGWAHFSKEYASSHIDRKSVIFKEAKERGIEIETVQVFGKNMAQARAWLPVRRGSKKRTWWYFEHIPIPPWKESARAMDLDNKEELKKLFRKQGFKVAKGGPVLTSFGAQRLLRKLHAVIVKPLDGSRARHTSVNVRDKEELRTAVGIARQICPIVMVEEFVPGTVHRATCVDGTLIGVVKFARPTAVGDGAKTADALRADYNARIAHTDVRPVEHNALFETTLLHQGLTIESVPEAGREITLAEFSERANGGMNVDMTDEVPEQTRALIERAAQATGLAVVGFDLITKDIANLNESITFLEANTAPFIELHHAPTIGTPRNVAGKVLDLWIS